LYILKVKNSSKHILQLNQAMGERPELDEKWGTSLHYKTKGNKTLLRWMLRNLYKMIFTIKRTRNRNDLCVISWLIIPA
jgi:hypothetical protein